jgi:hypothetical protein
LDRVKHARLAALVACAAVLLGCQEGVIDGWPIGAEVLDCASRTFTPSCDQLVAAAESALVARDGPHSTPIVAVKLYYEAGGPTRTVANTVAVFVLSDGRRRAIFTSWSPGGSITVDYGP